MQLWSFYDTYAPTKCIVRAESLSHVGFGWIHEPRLAQGWEYAVARPAEAEVLHMRHRDQLQRQSHDYHKNGSSPGASNKQSVMQLWEVQRANGRLELRPDLLRFVSDIHLRMLDRARSHAGGHAQLMRKLPTLPTERQRQLNQSRFIASRVVAVLVSAPRSGSTFVAEAAFNSLESNPLYFYEPCRQFPREFSVQPSNKSRHTDPSGRLHGSGCARFAISALMCRLDPGEFARLREDAHAMSVSRFGKLIEGMGDAEAYLRYMRACWSSHRMAKIVRLGQSRLEEVLPVAAPLVRVNIVSMLRHPAAVLASWRSLRQFANSSEWNPQPSANPSSMLKAICAPMNAACTNVSTGGDVSPLVARHYIVFERFVADPIYHLTKLYRQLGLPDRISKVTQKLTQPCTTSHASKASGDGVGGGERLLAASRFQVGRCLKTAARPAPFEKVPASVLMQHCGAVMDAHYRA